MSVRVPDPRLGYFLRFVFAVSITAVVDAVLIVPMVEVDPALSIVIRRSATLESIRAIGPSVLAVVLIIGSSFAYTARLRRDLVDPERIDRARSSVLRGPRILGMIVAAGWTTSLLFGLIMDFFTISFPQAGEAAVYYTSTIVAIISTGLFGFLVTYAVADQFNRKRLVPAVFPEGNVSRSTRVRPITFPQKLRLLWFGVSFFPLVVLGLGIYTRRYVPENEFRAYLFVLLFLPTSFFLVYRVGRGIQQPLFDLVEATKQITDGSYGVSIRSYEHDELGFLVDSTRDMAIALEEKEILSESFGRSVDPRVRDHLLDGNIDLGGERRFAAIMFCDIRGFTTFSENRSEELVVSILNEHFEAMNAAIDSHNGMINKFLGDGFLALFGVPVAAESPCADAVNAAIACVEANTDLNRTRSGRGDPSLTIGIGVHYGPVVAGNIGSPRRSEYTVIGDTVNLTSRIEGLSSRVGMQIVVTDAVADRLVDLPLYNDLADLGAIEVRGRAGQVHIFGSR